MSSLYAPRSNRGNKGKYLTLLRRLRKAVWTKRNITVFPYVLNTITRPSSFPSPVTLCNNYFGKRKGLNSRQHHRLVVPFSLTSARLRTVVPHSSFTRELGCLPAGQESAAWAWISLVFLSTFHSWLLSAETNRAPSACWSAADVSLACPPGWEFRTQGYGEARDVTTKTAKSQLVTGQHATWKGPGNSLR